MLIDLLMSIGAFLIGAIITLIALRSAVRTFVLPRASPDALTRFIYRRSRSAFNVMLKLNRARSYEDRDRIMAYFAPVTLMLYPTALLACVLVGYTLVYWGLGVKDPFTAFKLSGSSMLTLGFATFDDFGVDVFIFLQAVIGLGLTAILIAYIPTMYSAFSKREALVAMLETRAGSPPSALELIVRFHGLGNLGALHELWMTWEQWFAELDETHTSLSALAFYRSPRPERSWVTAAGAILDAASLRASTLDLPRDVNAEICVRAGYLALRHISDFFGITYDPDPRPNDPISITRSEWDDVYDQMLEIGVPLKEREQAWIDFAGWRVNYDTVLLALSALTMAPYAMWSSDRSFLPIAQKRTARRRVHGPFESSATD